MAFVYHSNQSAADSLWRSSPWTKGREVRAVQADVIGLRGAEAVAAELVDEWEQLDILVNSAGVIRDGLFATMNPINGAKSSIRTSRAPTTIAARWCEP